MIVSLASLSLLIDVGVNSLPINSRAIAEKHWKLYTYDDFADKIQKSKSCVETEDKDGFTYWSSKEQTYVICYNSERTESQINWTIMHEIAHIVLGHISPNTPVLPDDNCGLMELQAQEFTMRVLCPTVIWSSCNVSDTNQLADLCNVPKAEIKNVHVNTLTTGRNTSLKLLEKYVKKQFALFLINRQNKYDCEFALAF